MFIVLIVGVIPLAITMFLVLAFELVIYVLPGEALDLPKYYNDIYFIILIVFGPYYLQKEWNYVDTQK